MGGSRIQLELDYAAAIADWFLDLGDGYARRGDFEAELKCNYLAANILQRQSRDLSSPRLESNLQQFARRLSEPPDGGTRAPRSGFAGAAGGIDPRPVRAHSTLGTGHLPGEGVWLHVLSEALPSGGHTAMALRWMKQDAGSRKHCAAILSQTGPVPGELVEAVREAGGRIYTPQPSSGWLEKAAWLRNLALDVAGAVVLHIDVSDVICGAAFGQEGGPPVLLVNHAAHIFWTGVSIADQVVNCRGSELETYWTRVYRGAPRCVTIPIPLLDIERADSTNGAEAETKARAKENLGIPQDALLLLTIGAPFKYLASNQQDFVQTGETILAQLPEAYLVAVGPEADERWQRASGRSGSRLRAVGTQSRLQVARYHEAADIYIEGFPFGSTTALLEAGLRGIPVVPAPAVCPPPYGSDGVALDHALERPRTVEDYIARVLHLSQSAAARTDCGNVIREAVKRHHTGAGWRQYLDEAIKALPRQHGCSPPRPPVRTPEAIHEYWSEFRRQWASGNEETIEAAVAEALALGLRPKLTRNVMEACRRAKVIRRHRTIPLPLLALLCDGLLRFLPTALACRIFAVFSFLCRGALLSRTRKRIALAEAPMNARVERGGPTPQTTLQPL